MLNMSLCFICALGIAMGQILIKGAGVAWSQAGSLFDATFALWIGSAFFIYSSASIGWVYILKAVPLSAAYPFLGITFLFVPIAAHLFFNESLGWRDGIAALLIISGICLVSFGRSSS